MLSQLLKALVAALEAVVRPQPVPAPIPVYNEEPRHRPTQSTR